MFETWGFSFEEKEGAACTFVQMAEGSGGLYGFRIISNDGDRIQLGIRALANLSARGRSVTSDEVKGLPETSYLFQPGKSLQINVPGSGVMVITGELLDHLPSVALTDDEPLHPKAGVLRALSPILLRGKEVAVDFDGLSASSSNKDSGVWLYAPGAGRYVLSLAPFEGAVEGRADLNRVSFEMNGESYAFLMAAPAAAIGEHVWILHDMNFAGGHGKACGAENLNHLLAKSPANS
ncbi:MAG TPA: hypothetical protein VFE61_01835 [Candidatus Sulfotelmatobacter sp.]|nr:hypothetical protein [Candidatus Sulfotelmatobacter sp.]